MKQSRAMSLVESIANVAVGFGVAVATQIAVFPLFGLHVTLGENVIIGALFTVVSICRSFVLRRVFEAILVRNSSAIDTQKDFTWQAENRHRPRSS